MFAVIASFALMVGEITGAGAVTGALEAPVVQSQAWTEAEANRPRMKTAPTLVDGPQAELPEAEKALGHHGPVIIQGVIGIDGRMHEARVKRASGAPTLDQLALAAANASTFTPAKDADGVSLPVVNSMRYELAAYEFTGERLILHYKCDQFVRDMDWWKSVHPDTSVKEHELYQAELGLEVLTSIRGARANHDALRQRIAAFEARWNAAIAFCRRNPNAQKRDAR